MFSLKFSDAPADASLRPRFLKPLPLGTVRPGGWLKNQLRIQANGLSGHLDEFWPSVSDSRWIGGEHEGWERGPYWLDGIVPLAVLLQDETLLAKSRRWIDYILEHQHDDGWLGPKEDPHEGTGEVTLDPWPLFVLFKVFTQWQEATGDERIIPAMLRAARSIQNLLAEKPLKSWAKVRWADLVLSLHWLYERTEEPFLLELADTAHGQSYDWVSHFEDFTCTEPTDPKWLAEETDEGCLPLHGVNNAMGVKSGAVWSRQSGDSADAWASLQAVRLLDQYHGQVTGMFSGDEHLAGRDPIHGTETCTVTEYMFTLEQLIALTGEPALCDRLESIAYNALPAALTKDMWARQYDQQPNQVLCDVNRRDWISNGAHSNLFSLEGNFGCCTANFHQGWPKFASHLWMEAGEGFAAVAYAPSTVSGKIDGVDVTITEETEYPFRGEIRFTVQASDSVSFPLYLHIPAWAIGATITVGGNAPQNALVGAFHQVERTWQNGDTVTLRLPMALRREDRFNGATSILRGPLVMSLRIGENIQQIGGILPHADFSVTPTTPWNYALVISDAAPAFAVRHAAVADIPFSATEPAVVVSAPARCLPDWNLKNGSAALPARTVWSEVPQASEIETVELVPYGGTHLRVSEFPAHIDPVRGVTIGAGGLLHLEKDTALAKLAPSRGRFTRHVGEATEI